MEAEHDESKLAEGPLLRVVCGWCNDWYGLAVALKLVFVWNWILMVLLIEWVSPKFSGTNGGLEKRGIVVVIKFNKNVWSFDLVDWWSCSWIVLCLVYYNQWMAYTWLGSPEIFWSIELRKW